MFMFMLFPLYMFMDFCAHTVSYALQRWLLALHSATLCLKLNIAELTTYAISAVVALIFLLYLSINIHININVFLNCSNDVP